MHQTKPKRGRGKPAVRIGDHVKIQNYALVYGPAELESGVFVGPAAVLTNDVAGLSAGSPGLRRTVGFLPPSEAGGPLVAGMTVRLRCQGRGCPFSRRTVGVRKKVAKVRIGRELVGVRLAPGAKLTLAIARPGHVGKVMRYVIRRRGRAKVSTLCTQPGEARPREGCG